MVGRGYWESRCVRPLSAQVDAPTEHTKPKAIGVERSGRVSMQNAEPSILDLEKAGGLGIDPEQDARLITAFVGRRPVIPQPGCPSRI
jgi:hypothetical protein